MLTSKEQQTLLIRQDHYQKSPTVGQKKKKSRNYYLTKQKVSGYQIEHLSIKPFLFHKRSHEITVQKSKSIRQRILSRSKSGHEITAQKSQHFFEIVHCNIFYSPVKLL
jgi:hypothetical protein